MSSTRAERIASRLPPTGEILSAEHVKQDVAEREQTHNGTNLPTGRVERSQAILVRMSSMLMHTMTNWHTETLESIVQQLGKLIEVGLMHVVSYHPLEGKSLIFLKGESSIELLNDLLIVVTLNVHEVKQSEPLHNLQSITKVFRLLPEMSAVQHMHVANPLRHSAVNLLIDELLIQTPESDILKFFISSFSKAVKLPQCTVVHGTHGLKVDLGHPCLATCSLLCCFSLCSLLSSLLFSLVSQVLILKGSFGGKLKVPIASSGTSTLVTMRTRARATCERNRENSMGFRTHTSRKRGLERT
jgi:hypothetical protein